MTMKKSRGQSEAEISEAMIKFEKEYMGRGPLETKTYIIEDLVLVRLRGVLTPSEFQLAASGSQSDGRELIKQVRMTLLEKGRPLLEAVVESVTGKRVVSLPYRHQHANRRKSRAVHPRIPPRICSPLCEAQGFLFR
jgi:uncharacterized protein YbcI